MTDAASVANQVSTVDEAILRALPFVSTFLGFIPGAQVALPFMPLVAGLLQAVDIAAKTVAANNPDASAGDVIHEVINHLSANQPNSPSLTPASPWDPTATRVG